MMVCSPREIRKAYTVLKGFASKYVEAGDIENGLKHIGHCVTLAQQFNWIYADDELEDLMVAIGSAIIPENKHEYTPVSGRVVLLDDFSTSFILALQYLDALIEDGKEVLYITSKKVDAKSKFANIIETVKQKPNVCVHVVPQGKAELRNRDLYEAIVGFRPEKLLLHIKAFSATLPALYRLPKPIQRYIINLADQTFWLGKKAIDHCIEFRQFGVSVSQQRRGIRSDQQLLIPFYPIVDGNPFEGFPKECTSDKVVVFSGGDLYKVKDEKKTYWKLVKWLLDNYPQVVFLFATKVIRSNTDIIGRFIKDNGFQGRFIHINYRKDINEVFKHCDVYMGTCPASGSLMSQLAAVNAKPILQFYYPGTPDDETEQAICYNDKFSISFQDEDLFKQEAHRLITDMEYRKKQGERLKKAMISHAQFNKLVADSLSTNDSQVPLEPFEVDYSLLDERWFALERISHVDTISYLCGVLEKKYIWRFMPTILIKKYLNIIRGLLS